MRPPPPVGGLHSFVCGDSCGAGSSATCSSDGGEFLRHHSTLGWRAWPAGLGRMGPHTHPESRGVTAPANSAWSSDLTTTHPRGLYASRTITTWKPREAEAEPASAPRPPDPGTSLCPGAAEPPGQGEAAEGEGTQQAMLAEPQAHSPPAETTVSGVTCSLG